MLRSGATTGALRVGCNNSAPWTRRSVRGDGQIFWRSKVTYTDYFFSIRLSLRLLCKVINVIQIINVKLLTSLRQSVRWSRRPQKIWWSHGRRQHLIREFYHRLLKNNCAFFPVSLQPIPLHVREQQLILSRSASVQSQLFGWQFSELPIAECWRGSGRKRNFHETKIVLIICMLLTKYCKNHILCILYIILWYI